MFEPLLGNFLHVHPPFCYHCPYGKTYDGGACGITCADIVERTIVAEEIWDQTYRAQCFEKACFVSDRQRRYVVRITERQRRTVIDWVTEGTYTGPNTLGTIVLSRHEETFPYVGPFVPGRL